MLDEIMMNRALKMAEKGFYKNEVPIGAVIVLGNKVIAETHNKCFNNYDVTLHAEILAIRNACIKLKSNRLIKCKLYVTLEPCCMCAGAIFHSRIQEVIFGASDSKFGVAQSQNNLFDNKNLNHHTSIRGGVKSEESKKLLNKFFLNKRI